MTNHSAGVTMAPMRTLFTAETANKTLPLVRRIVAEILEKGGELRALIPGRKNPDARTRIAQLEDELPDLMRELEAIGCFYKDWGFDKGLVDFPAKVDGRHVFLCWRSDEPQVEWYHTHEAGYAGRQPIPDEA
jgi:hypothetical protein